MTVKTATGAPARLPGSATPKQGLWAWLNKRLPADELAMPAPLSFEPPQTNGTARRPGASEIRSSVK